MEYKGTYGTYSNGTFADHDNHVAQLLEKTPEGKVMVWKASFGHIPYITYEHLTDALRLEEVNIGEVKPYIYEVGFSTKPQWESYHVTPPYKSYMFNKIAFSIINPIMVPGDTSNRMRRAERGVYFVKIGKEEFIVYAKVPE